MTLVVGFFDEAPSTNTADVCRRVEDRGGGGGEFGRGTHADVSLNLKKYPFKSLEFVFFALLLLLFLLLLLLFLLLLTSLSSLLLLSLLLSSLY